MPESGEVRIIPASARKIGAIRRLWREYWDSLGFPPDFQGFSEELQSLPGVYAPPRGRLLLALFRGRPVGTIALRPLAGQSCEGKRLYVRPSFRGKGIGRALLDRLVEEARAAGYGEMYGDTLKSMTTALHMYRRAGFLEVGRYSLEPTPGAVFFRLRL